MHTKHHSKNQAACPSFLTCPPSLSQQLTCTNNIHLHKHKKQNHREHQSLSKARGPQQQHKALLTKYL